MRLQEQLKVGNPVMWPKDLSQGHLTDKPGYFLLKLASFKIIGETAESKTMYTTLKRVQGI